MGKLLTNQTAAWLAGRMAEGRAAPPPRRAQGPRDLGDATAPVPQWTLELAEADGGATVLRVGRGIVHWGGQHWAVWPDGGHGTAEAFRDLPLDLADGAAALVVWHTSESPVPLHYCPLQPSGPAVNFRLAGAECACTLSGYPQPGDPDSFTPDPGEVSLHAPEAVGEAGAEWTDCVPLGIVERAGETYTVTQLHDCTIAVRAIVRGDEDEPGEDGDPDDPPTDPDAPPCGHPGNNPGGGGDGDHPDGGDDDHPGGDDDHPGDNPSPPSSGDCP